MIFNVPDGYCPNCWGEQEYDSKIRTLVHDLQVDVNNKAALNSFIKDFNIKYLDGIKLQKDKLGFYCPHCNFKK